MKNTLKYILIASIMMFVGMNSSKANNACKYVMEDQLSGKYLDVDVYFNDSGKPSRVVLNSYGNKNSLNKSESINNWDDTLTNKRLESGTCPKYIVVKEGWFGNYDLYLNYKYDTAKNHCDSKNAPDTPISYSANGCMLVTSNESNSNNQVIKNSCEEDIKSTLTIFQDFIKADSSTVGCRNTDGTVKYVAYKECSEAARFNHTMANSLYNNAVSCVNMGYVPNTSSYYKKIVELYPSVIEKANSYSSQVKAESDYYTEHGEVYEKAGKEEFDGCINMPETSKLIKQVYNLIRYLIPVLIIVLSLLDFIKVVANGDDKAYKSAWDRFIKRIIVGFIILIVPTIISFIIDISGVASANGTSDLICILK